MGRRQLDKVIDTLWVVVPHKCLAVLSFQRTEGAAEGRLSQNTTLDILEAKDPNPQQTEAGVAKCVWRYFSLHSTKISCAAQRCAGACRMSGADGTFSSTKASMSETGHRHHIPWDHNDFPTK